MSRSDAERIADILEAAAHIASVVERGKDEWHRDPLSQRAVERLLEIIGESARAMSKGCRAHYSDIPWADVIGMRTMLAHHYHRIDPEQVWTIAANEVPRLVTRLHA